MFQFVKALFRPAIWWQFAPRDRLAVKAPDARKMPASSFSTTLLRALSSPAY